MFKNSPTQLEKAVSKQPVSVAIQANLRSFQLYRRGIYSDEQCVEYLGSWCTVSWLWI